MSESPDFLLVRAADLLVLGVRWSDLELVQGAGPGGSPARLVAQSDTARVVLTFPPQAIAEAKFTALGEIGRRGARLAGPSRVAFQVTAATEIELSPDGLLAALANGAQKVISTGEGMPTAIELPWHLIVSAQATSGVDVVSDHLALPLASESGVVGLWHARLRAGDGTAIDAGLALLALDANQDDAPFEVGPLNGGQRQSIKIEADQGRFAHTRRLELSSLGGSLSARLETEAIDWDHDATLGRDQRVRVLQRGVLYPFGHRAEYTEIAERIFDPAGSPTVAGMHRQVLLRVTEPIRVMTDGSTELLRSFPFSEVEILTRSFADLKAAEFKTHKRPRLTDQDLIDQIAALRVDLDPPSGLLQGFSDAFALEPQSRDAYVLSELGSAPALREARLKRDITDPDGMQQRRNDLLAEKASLLSQIPVDPPPPPDEPIVEGEPPPPPPEVDDEFIDGILAAVAEIDILLATEVSEAAIAQARIDAPIFAQRAADLEVVVTAEFENRDTLDEFIASQASFNPDAQRVLDLNNAIAEIEARIREIAAAAEVENDVYWTPQTKDGLALQFPLRCRAANGDVFFSVPLVFIKDLKIDAGDHFDAFDALTDQVIAQRVKQEWDAATASGTIPLPGVSIDMVRDSPELAQPGDVHEVHALTLEAVPHDGGFRPKVTQFEVELPAIRTLLPEDLPGARPVLKFTESFLRQDVIPPIPFELPELDGVPQVAVDFTEAANRSGGLVSPKFAANLISRELGPVASDALPPELAEALPAGLPEFNLETAYEGATLLGFPLAALIKLPDEALPPAIVQLFKEGGIPNGMQMNWTLDLEEHGPFRPGPETKLNLTVECSLAKRETTCKVNDFKLVLPPGGSGDGLLTLEFGALRFTQREGQAPDLEIVGLHVGFGGALKLLQELQEELEKVIDLPDNRPTVDVRPTGLTAGYGISVPSVPTGAFLIRNIAMHVGVDVPFDGKPVSVSLSFATRHDPFNVSVLMFGGGGYIDLTLGPEGLTRLEASIDFGASLEVDFFIAKGEVHALAGVRFTQSGGTIAIDGFIRIGGSVEVLGLVSVSIELVVTLTYDDRDGNNRLVGRATLVIEIDLTLYADSVEIDSGEWVLAGSSEAPHRDPVGAPEGLLAAAEADPLDELKRYREAFASR